MDQNIVENVRILPSPLSMSPKTRSAVQSMFSTKTYDSTPKTPLGNYYQSKDLVKQRMVAELKHFSERGREKQANLKPKYEFFSRSNSRPKTLYNHLKQDNGKALLRGASCKSLKDNLISCVSPSVKNSATPLKSSKKTAPSSALKGTRSAKISRPSSPSPCGDNSNHGQFREVIVKKNKNTSKSTKKPAKTTIESEKLLDTSNIFSESSRKLAYLDNIIDDNHKFKKEIRNLIQVIKQEKDQINLDLEKLSMKLVKYKVAYKKLKKKHKDVEANIDEDPEGKMKNLEGMNKDSYSESRIAFNIEELQMETSKFGTSTIEIKLMILSYKIN
jgi:hypothetical protein